MIVEIVIAECHPLHIVLTVEQTIIAIFVGCIAIEEFTMVYPNMSTPVGLGTNLISLNTDAVWVANFYLFSISISHYLILTSSEHRYALHSETTVADNDIIYRLHHEGDMCKQRSLASRRIYHTDKSFVRSKHNTFTVCSLHATLSTLVVK
ncbi:unknown [Prevotella sp. CAG:1092]|nr:unknown [Prevotella sp. CAG:1092]